MPGRTSITASNPPAEYATGLRVVAEIPPEIPLVDAQAIATREFIFGVAGFILDLLGDLLC